MNKNYLNKYMKMGGKEKYDAMSSEEKDNHLKKYLT